MKLIPPAYGKPAQLPEVFGKRRTCLLGVGVFFSGRLRGSGTSTFETQSPRPHREAGRGLGGPLASIAAEVLATRLCCRDRRLVRAEIISCSAWATTPIMCTTISLASGISAATNRTPVAGALP